MGTGMNSNGQLAQFVAGVVGDLDADLGEAAATTPSAIRRLPALPSRQFAYRPSSPAEAFNAQLRALRDVLTGLEAADWTSLASPYEWTVHGLVAHLLVVERYMGRVIGRRVEPPHPGEGDHLGMDLDIIAAEVTRDPDHTAAEWFAEAHANLQWAEQMDADTGAEFHGWPFHVGSLMVARTFELWTHADDIRRACGQPMATPSAGDLATMSNVSVTSLPLTAHVVRPDVPDVRARVVLTGDGGGVWDLTLGRGGDEAVTVIADVVDYCRMAARRIAPEALDIDIEGDAHIASLLLKAASVVSI
jgi:uncharacterized protein (TIGR03083 family)